MTSAERRVTVSGTIYPKLQKLAERDGVAVADVVNAIVLQVLQPYGVNGQSDTPPVKPIAQADAPDPYQSAIPNAW